MRFSLLSAAFLAFFPVSVSVSGMDADSLRLSVGVCITPSDLLRGTTAGVRVSSTDGNPAGVTNVNIRGLNSLRGSNEPLWIVDGAVLSNSMNENSGAFWQSRFGDYGYTAVLSQMDNWNLYDIESIQVLKDVSETSLYGSRGANGVILINTRQPEGEKMRISLDSNFGLNISEISSPFLRPSLSHNHSLSIGSSSGRTRVRLSAFYRDVSGVVPGSGDDFAGLRLMFDTKANAVVHFGMNFAISAGSQQSQYGTAWYGAPSTMLAIRGIKPMDGRLSDPQGWLDGYSDDTRIFRTTDSFYLNLNFTPAFRWKNTASVDAQTNNRYIWFDETTSFGSENTGSAGLVMSSLLNADFKSALQFEKYLSDAHHIDMEAAAEIVYSMDKFDTMNGTNFLFGGLGARGFGFRESFDDPADFEKSHNIFGFSATAGYDFRRIFGVNASLRADRNLRFDDDFILYPALSAYFDAGRMFLSGSDRVSSLLLKAGYGVAGYGKYIPYESYSNYTVGNYPEASSQISAFYEGFQRLRTTEYSVSLDAGFLEDRLGAVLTWYSRETGDNLSMYRFGRNTDSGIWVVSPKTLVASQESAVSNSGVELSLSASILRGKDLVWDISGNMAYNSNRLLKVDPEDVCGLKLNPGGLVSTINSEGSSVSSLFGNILDEDYVLVGEGIIGNAVPKVYGGFRTSLRFKSFAFEAKADYALGQEILNMNRMLFTSQVSPSNIYVEKGDYLRLSCLSARYDIPVSRIRWINSLSVSLSATNLFTLTGYSGWNPDVNCFGSTNLSGGIDYGSYPLVRIIMLGVHASF